MFWWTHRYRAVEVPNFEQLGGLSYFSLRSMEQFIAFSIPVFLFVSGYFVAFQAKRGAGSISREFIFNRLRFLLIPFLIWSIVMLLVDYVQGDTYTTGVYIRKILLGEASPAFYYVPLITQLYVLSPLLCRVMNRSWKTLIFIVAVSQGLVLVFGYGFLLDWNLPARAVIRIAAAGWFFPTHWFWFVLGIFAGYQLELFKGFAERTRWFFVCGAIIFLVLGIVEWEQILHLSGGEWLTPKETLIDNVYSFAILMALFGFTGLKLPFNAQLEQIGKISYGVYLSHSLVLMIAAKLIYHFLPRALEYQVVFQTALFILGLGLPVLAIRVLKASRARNISVYIFG